MPTNKETAWSFFATLSQGRVDDAMAMLDAEGTWWNVGPRAAIPMTTFKSSAAAIMRLMPMRFTLHGAIEEGDRVLLEIESESPRPGGGTYNNRYCYVVELAAGRLLHVREYPDTKYASEMLPADAWAHEQASWRKHHGRYWHRDTMNDRNENNPSTIAARAPSVDAYSTLQRLDAIESIRQVTYRYFRSVDTGDFAGATDCFTDDATVALIGGSYRFERQGRDAIRDSLPSILNAGIAAMHTAHHPEIVMTGPDTADGTWYLTDWAISLEHKTVTSGACLVRNRYRKVDGTWRIQHYGYTRIYEQTEQLARLPQISAHALGDSARDQASAGNGLKR